MEDPTPATVALGPILAGTPYHPQAAATSVGIIGGGRAGLQIFALFEHSQMTRVAYMVDRNGNAPAIEAARAAGIPTFTDLDRAISSATVDYVFEVTGTDDLIEYLHQALADRPTHLVTHDMAYILINAFHDQRAATVETLANGIGEIKSHVTRSIDAISTLAENIKDTTGSMRILALNARIEAARAGNAGKGFAVVAEHMERAAETVRELTSRIEQINETIRPVLAASDRIETSLEHLG